MAELPSLVTVLMCSLAFLNLVPNQSFASQSHLSRSNCSLLQACTNIYLLQYEMCTTGHGMIESFNVCTNKWAAQYAISSILFDLI